MGLALLWKPTGIGSQEALGQFRRALAGVPELNGADSAPPKKGGWRRDIGHTGTLDPFAEGLLLCGWGEGTKLLAPLTGLDKSYRAEIILGATTETLDETSALEFSEVDLPSLAKRLELEGPAWIAQKIGRFEQIPPAYSAVHVDGKRAYDLAREGKKVELKARPAEILSARSLEVKMTESKSGAKPLLSWTIEVSVSTGTYIRALARDWATELCGSPGYLRTLVRTGIGPFQGTDAKDFPRHLSAKDLVKSELMSSLSVEASRAEHLSRYGRFDLIPETPLNCLILDPNGRAIAWFDVIKAAIGRVFLNDPFAD